MVNFATKNSMLFELMFNVKDRKFFSMKKIIPFLVTAITLLVAGCNRENDVTETNQLRYAKIPVSLDQQGSDPDTRSLISIESEHFQNAFLVAFGSDGNVLTYQENAGDLENTGPVYIEVTEKTFDWALPINVDMDIYVLVNYTSLSDVGITLNGNLKKSDLDNLYYSCATQEAFLAIDETKMPMTGIVHTRLTSYNDVLNVTVKRLFAKYEFTFNTTAFRQEGYDLTAAYMRAMNCSASVPYFVEDGDGYKVTTDANGVPQNVVEIMDELTEAQVSSLFNSPQPARLYFLENCQGNLGTASSWDHVYDELGAATMACATFVEIHLTATKDGKSDEFVYRVYLGKTDQKSNFDVQRNVYKQLTITLKPIISEGPNPPGPSPFNGFSFLPGTYTVEPGGTIDIPFETNLTEDLLRAHTSDNTVLTFNEYDLIQDFRTTNATGVTRYAHSGKMRFTAVNGTYDGDKNVTVTGGIISQAYNSDNCVVMVNTGSAYFFEGIEIECAVTSAYNNRTVYGHGENMNVTVTPNDGNNCTFVLNAKVKYDGQWHQMTPQTGNPEPRISFWMTGFGSDIASNRTVLHWGGTLAEYYIPGDRDEVRIYFDDICVASWFIYYGPYSASPYMSDVQDVNVTCGVTVIGRHNSVYSSNFTTTGGNMNVPVSEDGNFISYSVDGTFKWQGNWYEIGTWAVNTNMNLSVNGVERPFVSGNSTKIRPGDRVHFEIYDGYTLLSSWYVTGVSTN